MCESVPLCVVLRFEMLAFKKKRQAERERERERNSSSRLLA